MRAIQVTKSLEDPDVRERELRGLVEAMNQYQLTEGIILTLDEEGHEEPGGMQIQIIPVWKWLLFDFG